MADDQISITITAETNALVGELADAQASLRGFGDEVRGLADRMKDLGDQRMAEQQVAAWRGAIREIDSAEDVFVRTILTRRQSLSQSLMQMSARMAEQEIANDLKWVTNKLIYNALGLASDQATEQGGLLAHLLTETAKTTATVTGASERAAADETASSGSILSMIGNALKAITVDAGQTFAGIFAFLAPTLGPAAAGPAAASQASVLATAATLGIGGFDVGAWNLPSDMLAVVHAGETILPANFAAGFRGAVSGGSGGGSGVTFAPQVSAVDSKSVVALFNNPSIMRQFAKNLGGYLALNPSTRGAY
jgi:hypothetical protein